MKTMKKRTALLLAALLVFCGMALTAYANRTGDMDGDGKVTAKDARFVLRLSARLENASAAQKSAADVDGDNKVTAKDARIILRVSAKLTSFEAAGKAQANRQKLEALGTEALAYVSGRGYFAGYFFLPGVADDGVWAVMAYDGTNELMYYAIGDHPLATMTLNGRHYWMDPDTAICVEVNRTNARILGQSYDAAVNSTQLVDFNYVLENADVNTYQVTLQEGPAYRTEIIVPGIDTIECLYTRNGKLVMTQSVDRNGKVTQAYVYTTVSPDIPNNILSASTYSLASDANVFKQLVGMA